MKKVFVPILCAICLGLFLPGFSYAADAGANLSNSKMCDALDPTKVHAALQTLKPMTVAPGQSKSERYVFPDGSYAVVTQSSTTPTKLNVKQNTLVTPSGTPLGQYHTTSTISYSGYDIFGARLWTLTFNEDFDYNGFRVTWVDPQPWFGFSKEWYSVWTMTNQNASAQLRDDGTGFASGSATLSYGVGSIGNIQTIVKHAILTLNGDGTSSGYFTD